MHFKINNNPNMMTLTWWEQHHTVDGGAAVVSKFTMSGHTSSSRQRRVLKPDSNWERKSRSLWKVDVVRLL
jgi:hypothetical protein